MKLKINSFQPYVGKKRNNRYATSGCKVPKEEMYRFIGDISSGLQYGHTQKLIEDLKMLKLQDSSIYRQNDFIALENFMADKSIASDFVNNIKYAHSCL